MTRNRCDHLIPRGGAYFRAEEGELRECLLAEGHEGGHLARDSFGEYYDWLRLEPRDCDEEECGKEYCECIAWGTVPEKDALARIEREGPD